MAFRNASNSTYGATILTFANTPFIHVLANFIAHLHRMGEGAPAVEVHALDDATFVVCRRLLQTSEASKCVRAGCCDWSDGFHPQVHSFIKKAATVERGRRFHSAQQVCDRGRCDRGLRSATGGDAEDIFLELYRNATRSNAEVVRGVQSQLAAQSRKDELDALATRLNTLQLVEAIQMYKLQAAYERLRREPARPVLLLDATSLVGSRACFDELLACNEDIVISAEPKRGCPPALSFVLGAVANTGVTLIRSGGLPFLRSVLVHQRGRYQHHCYEQEAFNAQLVASRFTWASFPYVGTTADEHGGRAPNGTTFRFLNYSHWPRTYKKKRRRSTANETWFSEPPELACLFHPWVTDKSQHIAIYKQAGRWYL